MIKKFRRTENSNRGRLATEITVDFETEWVTTHVFGLELAGHLVNTKERARLAVGWDLATCVERWGACGFELIEEES